MHRIIEIVKSKRRTPMLKCLRPPEPKAPIKREYTRIFFLNTSYSKHAF